MSDHSELSSSREKLLEHLFVGEVMRYLWCKGAREVELLRAEVDCGGYDLVLACNGVMRHVQLKASKRSAKTARQSVNRRLGDQPSGCVIWMYFDEKTLDLGPFRWFGGDPGEPLPDIRAFSVAKHTKANAQGVKNERPEIRVLKHSHFEQLESIEDVVIRLFGSEIVS